MNSRDRVRRAIEFGGPDRIPTLHGVLPAAFAVHGQALVDLLNEFPSDFRRVWTAPGHDDIALTYWAGTHVDEWGCVWNTQVEGMHGICVGNPLEDWSNWSSYKLPAVTPRVRSDERQDDPQASRGEYALAFAFNLFERMQWLRGYEALMTDIALRSPEAYVLRDALVEWAVEDARLSAETDVDGIHFGDDWGTQVSLIISPEAWRDLYKPAYARMFAPAKARGKHVHFHSDGFTWEILDDLIEIGVDVLNVQHELIGIRRLGEGHRGRVAFRSDLDRQHILPHGSRQQIRDHVKEVIDNLATPAGGLIGHGEIGPDVPLENVRAMLEAWREFGGP